METKIIPITQEDIDLGQQRIKVAKNSGHLFGLSHLCGIAIALQREFNDPEAHWSWTTGMANDRYLRALDGNFTNDWVTRHDSLETVKPFDLEVEILELFNLKVEISN